MFKNIYPDEKVIWTLEPILDYNTTVVKYDCRVKEGNIQSMSFEKEEKLLLPPFNDLLAPLENTPLLDKNGLEVISKKGMVKTKKGYTGKAKGIAQVLWERGLWMNTMRKTIDIDHPEYPDLCASYIWETVKILKWRRGQ